VCVDADLSVRAEGIAVRATTLEGDLGAVRRHPHRADAEVVSGWLRPRLLRRRPVPQPAVVEIARAEIQRLLALDPLPTCLYRPNDNVIICCG